MKRNIILLAFFFGGMIILQSFSAVYEKHIVYNTTDLKVDSAYFITDGRVGKLEINMDAAKLKNIFPEDRMKVKKSSSGDDEYAVYKIFEEDNKTLAIEIESLCADICMVSRINIFSPKYKTLAGVGVGSSFADIKKNYSMKNIVGGEGSTFMIYVKEFGDITFIVKSPDKNPKYGKSYEASEVPDSELISQIYIF